VDLGHTPESPVAGQEQALGHRGRRSAPRPRPGVRAGHGGRGAGLPGGRGCGGSHGTTCWPDASWPRWAPASSRTSPGAASTPLWRTRPRPYAPGSPRSPLAALNADLPALRPLELARVLDAAAEFPRAFLPDAAGIGTTLLAASPAANCSRHSAPIPAPATAPRAPRNSSCPTCPPYARTWTRARTSERHWHWGWARARRRRWSASKRPEPLSAVRPARPSRGPGHTLPPCRRPRTHTTQKPARGRCCWTTAPPSPSTPRRSTGAASDCSARVNAYGSRSRARGPSTGRGITLVTLQTF
jgi:hypothetical protein